jgi:succinyl-diaminopimelate desuccinylase
LAQRGETIDCCIVGEPTSVERLGDTIKNGRRGTLSGRLVVRGIQGHVAYPHLARNPIHEAAPVLAELAATRWDDGDEHFPPTTWQCSNIHAGTGATNVIPGSLEVQFNFRHGPASTQASLAARLESVLARHRLDYELAWTGSGKPYVTARGRLAGVVAESIRAVAGVEPELSCTGGTSDGRFIADICPEVIELGPVNATIHKIDECVRIADLDALSAIYAGILARLLAPGTRK